MSVVIYKAHARELFLVELTSETSYTVAPFGSRDAVTYKNVSAAACTLNCPSGTTIDGASSFSLDGYAAITLARGATEWIITESYTKEELGDSFVDDQTFEADITVAGDITQDEGTAYLANLSALGTLDTTTAVGSAFTNQPANDSVDVVSDDAGDTTQTATIIGTTNGTDTVVVETVTLTGTDAVTTAKSDWGVILAVKLSASCAGTITFSETSGSQAITTITTTNTSKGVNTVAAADQDAYNRLLSIVADGASTKQIGVRGTNTSDAVIYDSQALSGTTAVNSNSAFRTITEIYTGDLEAARTVTVTNDGAVRLNGAKVGYSVVKQGAGTAYALTDTAAAVTFGTTSPAITIDKAGTYLIMGQVQLDYNGATVVGETATVKVRRTNNTAADLSSVVVLDLPVATTLTHTYAVVAIPPFVYTTTATDDAVTLFANVSASLGAGTVDATAVGTKIVALRLY